MLALRYVPAATIALLFAATAGAALAQPASVDIGIRAVVPKYCTVNGTLAPITITVTIRTDAAGNVVTPPQAFTVPRVVCNSTADIIAASANGGARLIGLTPVVEGVGATVAYTAGIRLGSGSVSLATQAGGRVPGASGSTTPVVGQLVATITPAPNATPLQPLGVYRDTLTIRLVPR